MVTVAHPGVAHPGLAERMKRELGGTADVMFDAFSRGRYATDASSYQIMPAGVVAPRTPEAARAALDIARSAGMPVTARGGGTSQCGQTINSGIVVDGSKYLNRILDLDVSGQTCRVEPGIVLDDLNRQLKKHGLWFPVDVSTASRATIGGMVGNNSCGGRSLRYGTTRDNVTAIDAILADGTAARFADVAPDLSDVPANSPLRSLFADMLALGAREAGEIAARFPKVQRRVGGYNIDALVPGKNRLNMAHLLVGSEGTLGYSTAIDLKLSPLLGKRALGVCHFGSFRQAMDAAQHLVTLRPIAVELVDDTMLALAGDIAMFRPTLEKFVRGKPAALLLVEFAEEPDENAARMKRLSEMMGDLGFAWDKTGAHYGGVVEVNDPALQAAIADLRTSGLNIMMSMKDARKPVSFVEDCAVPLAHLGDYTDKLTAVFAKHGTKGTWYAHASEGCLHVRPVLNLKQDKDLKAMRAIAEEAFELVRQYKGSHSGEHGDGIVRSEFHEDMFGSRLVRAFEQVKDRFDPHGLYNPNKIVRAPKFDDRKLLRFNDNYREAEFAPRLDWSDYPGPSGGFQAAVEMCNNNGACRKREGGAMCPSFRVTGDEQHVTRGRANTLRLALSGQLGPDALASDDMAAALQLCVSCKACRRECPTGVDMARMKIEVQAARVAKNGLSLRDRLVAYLPRYAPYAAKLAPLMNLRNKSVALRRLMQAVTGFSEHRNLPSWRRDVFRSPPPPTPPHKGEGGDAARPIESYPGRGAIQSTSTGAVEDADVSVAAGSSRTTIARSVIAEASPNAPLESPSPSWGGDRGGERVVAPEVVLLADTFNRYFERENLDAAITVLEAAGYRVHIAEANDGSKRALCCGRTFLSAGLVDEARKEAERAVRSLAPFAARGVPIIGLEPSCLFSFRDEVPAMIKGDAARDVAKHARLFEEFISDEIAAGRFKVDLNPLRETILLHGHCHQKSFGAMGAVEKALRLIPDLKLETIESSCCGMAGSFGYQAETYQTSIAMAEQSLLPAVRKAPNDAIVVADGTSCRHQIADGSSKTAVHVAVLLAKTLKPRP